MGKGRNSWGRSLTPSDIRAPLVVGLLYAVLAAATIHFTSAETSVSVLWPANAVPLAMMMLKPRRHWWLIVVATFLGSVVGTFASRGVSLVPLPLAVANTLEILLAAWFTNFSRAQDGITGNARSMVRFVAAAGLLAPAISAIVGAATFTLFFGQGFIDAYLIWFFSDSLGILIFTPFFYALLAGEYRRAWREASAARRWETGLLMALTTFVALLVFEAQRPLLFLVIMPTMLVAFRLGWMGVKVAVMIVATTGAICTMSGHGPLMNLTRDPQMQAHFLQIFIAAQLLTQWPVVAALTARDRLMQQLASSERSLRFLAAQSSVLMLTFDVAGVCRKAVGASRLLPGHMVEVMPGLYVDELIEDAEALLRPAHEAALDIPDRVHSVEFRVGQGEEALWLEATFRALEDENGRCPGTVMTLHDISVRKHEAIELVRFAHTDSLTGLLNRAGFMVRLERALVGAPAGSMSLAMIDVDRFKLVNDNCGHQTGDTVLAEIALRIAAQLRATDSVARMGGDEFVVLLDTADWDDAQDVCTRLVRGVAVEPVRVESDAGTNRAINVAISCGVALYRGGLSAEQFLHDADVALYEAKRGGRNRMVAA